MQTPSIFEDTVMANNPGDIQARQYDTAPPRTRISADRRRTLSDVAVQRYTEGASIRKIAGEIGHSYGLVHALLAEAGVKRRPRGNQPKPATRRRPSGSPTAGRIGQPMVAVGEGTR